MDYSAGAYSARVKTMGSMARTREGQTYQKFAAQRVLLNLPDSARRDHRRIYKGYEWYSRKETLLFAIADTSNESTCGNAMPYASIES